MPDPGSGLQEKLAASLLAQIQKAQIKKGWDDWTLLYSSVCPLCLAAHSLWCYRCHPSRLPLAAPLGSSHKGIWCTTRGREWSFHLFPWKSENLPFWATSSVKKLCHSSQSTSSLKGSLVNVIKWMKTNRVNPGKKDERKTHVLRLFFHRFQVWTISDATCRRALVQPFEYFLETRLLCNQILLMGGKGRLSDPRHSQGAKEQSANARKSRTLLTEEKRSISQGCYYGSNSHTGGAERRPVSGRLESWGLIRTSISTEISCKWRQEDWVKRRAWQMVLKEETTPNRLNKTHFTEPVHPRNTSGFRYRTKQDAAERTNSYRKDKSEREGEIFCFSIF